MFLGLVQLFRYKVYRQTKNWVGLGTFGLVYFRGIGRLTMFWVNLVLPIYGTRHGYRGRGQGWGVRGDQFPIFKRVVRSVGPPCKCLGLGRFTFYRSPRPTTGQRDHGHQWRRGRPLSQRFQFFRQQRYTVRCGTFWTVLYDHTHLAWCYLPTCNFWRWRYRLFCRDRGGDRAIYGRVRV